MATEENTETKGNVDKLIVVDHEACIGCGTCEQLAEAYFKLEGDEKKSQVIKEYNEADKELIDNVIASCPVGAIILK